MSDRKIGQFLRVNGKLPKKRKAFSTTFLCEGEPFQTAKDYISTHKLRDATALLIPYKYHELDTPMGPITMVDMFPSGEGVRLI
jgi:hypothetical protein